MPPRKRAPLKSVGAPRTAPKPPPAPDLRVAVADSVSEKAMPWLADSDDGIKALALKLAEQIEEAQERATELDDLIAEFSGEPDLYRRLQRLEAMCNVTKIVGWLGPQLQGVLRDLGGTPASRLAMQKDKPVGGRLAQLRDAAGRAEK